VNISRSLLIVKSLQPLAEALGTGCKMSFSLAQASEGGILCPQALQVVVNPGLARALPFIRFERIRLDGGKMAFVFQVSPTKAKPKENSEEQLSHMLKLQNVKPGDKILVEYPDGKYSVEKVRSGPKNARLDSKGFLAGMVGKKIAPGWVDLHKLDEKASITFELYDGSKVKGNFLDYFERVPDEAEGKPSLATAAIRLRKNSEYYFVVTKGFESQEVDESKIKKIHISH
jgi:hypothetical protein